MKNSIVSILLLAGLWGCDRNEDTEPDESSQYHDSGVILSAYTGAGGRAGYYAGYYNSLEEAANVDLTQKSAYTNLWVYGKLGQYFYGVSTSGENKFAKMAVSKTTGIIEEVASFPLSAPSYFALVCNKDIGVVTQFNNLDLVLFNPTTMEQTGTVDMSKATNIDAKNRRYTYYAGVHRPADNRLFMFYWTDDPATGLYYEESKIYVEVINLNTKQWEKTISYNGGMYAISRGKENPVIDEQGNIYITCQGSYGLDGAVGPYATKLSRPQILKISAATNDFDQSYSFNPLDKLGYNNLMIQTLTGTLYDANGTAYACVNATDESPQLLQLIYKYATTGQLTEDEQAQLFNLAFYSVSQRWVKLDLNTQTVSVINDIPATGSFMYPSSYKHKGKLYFQYYDGTTSGFYSYDPSTNKATKVVNVTKGGVASELIFLDE
ncbi:MAG: hypothetical protein LRY55_10415 [Leadbetterella sp.]|nr:hypothetical protein [Leadbetterella sp.]